MFPLPNYDNSCFVDPLLSIFSDAAATSSIWKHDHDQLLLPFSSFSIPSSPFYLDQDDPAAFLQKFMDNYTTDATDPSQKEKPKKKDRHSKINTAQGPRDRRMRLSLEVARKFFDLQDMLEFDKASTTVEWLLKESKSAIKELSRSLKKLNGNGSPACSSDCDVVSGVFDESMDAHASNHSSALIDGSDKVPELPAKKEKKITTRTQKCRGIMAARESRKQARARAKERTMEKMWIRQLSSSVSNPSASEQIGTNQTVEESYKHLMKPSNTEQILGSSYSFNETYFQNTKEHPLRDFQMLPKPWEDYGYCTHLCSK